MASHEVFRPREQHEPEERSGSLGSQMNKYVGHETRVPHGKEWALALIRSVPEQYKELVTTFIADLPYGDRQRAAQHLSEMIDNMRDQIMMSKKPVVEIQSAINETIRQLGLPQKKGEK